jgi:alkaline phosphatase
VILGGGRTEFLPKNTTDEDGKSGSRTDGVDLIAKWKSDKSSHGAKFKYVSNREQLLNIKPWEEEFVLGE